MLTAEEKWSYRRTSGFGSTPNLITSSPFARAYHVWSTSVNAFVSYPAHNVTDKMTDRQTDKQHRSYNSEVADGSNNFPSYPPDYYHNSDVVYRRTWGEPLMAWSLHVAPAVRGGHWQRLWITYLTSTLTWRRSESSSEDGRRKVANSLIIELSRTDKRYAIHVQTTHSN